MWARGAAIRPVPKFARLDRGVLDGIEAELAACGSDPANDTASLYFGEFEKAQPSLAAHVTGVLSRRLDATAVSLGYFLTLAIWLAFRRSFEGRLREVDHDAIQAHRAALELERTIRAERAEEPIELEDILQQEQPAILSFVHLHVEVALDPETEGNESEVDVDDVHLVYETILVLTLALSHAVVAPGAAWGGTPEMMA